MNLRRIYDTVKYMTARQWKYRLYYTARNKLVKRKPQIAQTTINPLRLSMNYATAVRITEVSAANGILANRIPTISRRVEELESNIDWDMKGEDYRLVCFRLNSFRYLVTLSNAYKQTNHKKYIDKGFELIDDWLSKNNGIIAGDKWNAYVIADRLMNWIGFLSEYCENTEELTNYASHIYSQAVELMDSIEYQLGANHLLSEGRALIAAGAFLEDQRIYEYGKKVLRGEYKVQFLNDGGHYERSLSYHVESLQQYFEAIWIMNYLKDEDAVEFASMIRDSYKFLNAMIGSNGEIPLFNDAAIDYPFYDARDFLATGMYLYDSMPPNGRKGEYASGWLMDDFKKLPIVWDSEEYASATGIIHYKFNYDSSEYSFYLDAGNNGPDSNLGHTHADALSILFSDGEKNILVDSGVFTYQPGELRNECRATRAHNTIEIDNTSNTEIWSAFRVARRGHTIIDKYEQTEAGMAIRAIYDGYKKILKAPVLHSREVCVDKVKGIIHIHDILDCDDSHKAVLRYHIAPQCQVEVVDDNTCKIHNRYLIQLSAPFKLVPCRMASYFGVLEDSYCIECTFYTKDKKEIETQIKIIGGENG